MMLPKGKKSVGAMLPEQREVVMEEMQALEKKM